MQRVPISELEKAALQNSIGVTDATLAQGYLLLNPIDFIVSGTDVITKGMGFADVVNGNAPAITATPPSDPANPGRHTILRRTYRDLFRTWVYDGTSWSHVYDEIIRNTGHIELTAIEAQQAVPGGLNFPIGEMFVVPSYMNGAQVIEGFAVSASGAGSVGLSIFINGIAKACLTFACTSTFSQVFCPGIPLATGDVITISLSGLIGALNGATVTLVYTLP
jgi:hypothetical protein